VNIQCENCGAEHDLDPPAWVLSSGRPFRFRCSVCGHSQMAEPPTSVSLPDVDASQADASSESAADAPAAQDAPAASPAEAPSAPAAEPAESARGPSPTPSEAASSQGERPSAPSAPAAESGDESVFLKQDGKVYLVKDWATLQRWFMERRVGREDLVSEGGVRWEPIGSRPELGSFFAAVEQLEAAELAGLRGNETPFPTDGSSSWSFEDEARDPPTGLARLDDETEGVPLGLPPLPTEDLEGGPPEDSGYPDAPPSRLEAASAAPDDEPEAPADAPADEEPAPAVLLDDEPAMFNTPSDEPSLDEMFDEPSVDPVPPVPVAVEEDEEDEEDEEEDQAAPESEPEPEPADAASAPTIEDVAEPSLDDPEAPAAQDDDDELEGPYTDPTPSMPMFSTDDESAPIADTPVFAGREVSLLDETDSLAQDDPAQEDAEPLVDPYAEPGVAAEDDPSLGAAEPDDEADTPMPSLPPDEEEEDADVLGPAASEAPDDDDDPNTDEFDPDDPFRDFGETPAPAVFDEPAVVQPSGPPQWLIWSAIAVVTAAAALALIVGAQQGWFSPQDADTGLADVAPEEPQVPQTPADVEPDTEPEPAETEDTDAVDTDAAQDTDAAPDTDVVDTDAVADLDADTQADVEPDTEPDTQAPPPRRPSTPAPTTSLKNRGWAALDNGRYSEAADTFRRAIEAAPGDGQAHLGLGVSLLSSNQATQARTHICRAAELGPNDIRRQAQGVLSEAGLSCN